MPDDTHKALADEMREMAGDLEYISKASPRPPEITQGAHRARSVRISKWADRVEALGEQNTSTSEEVQTEQRANETLPLRSTEPEARAIWEGVRRAAKDAPDFVGGEQDSDAVNQRRQDESRPSEPVAPHCKHCGHSESVHSLGIDGGWRGCMLAKLRLPPILCDCPGYEG